MTSFPRVLGAVLGLCSLLLVAACGTQNSSGSNGSSSDGLTIVTSFYPLQFVSERVAGQHGQVSNLTTPGAEPHDLELSPRQVAEVSEADLVVYEKSFQPAVDEAVAQSGNDTVLDTTTVVPLEDHSAGGHGEDAEHSEDGDDHGDGHDHGDVDGPDPHVWLDPNNMVSIADAVADNLAEIDPDHASDFRANAATLTEELESLDADFRSGLQNCERSAFITSHAAFGYLAEAYGLEQIGISGLSPESAPSPSRIAEIQDEARQHGITTIFYETLVSPAVAESIAGDLDLKTDVLDPIEGLTEQSKGTDYLSVMEANLTALQQANGCR